MASSLRRKRKAPSPDYGPETSPPPRPCASDPTSSSVIEHWLRGHPNHQDKYQSFNPDNHDQESMTLALTIDDYDMDRGKYLWHCSSRCGEVLAAFRSFPNPAPAGLRTGDRSLCQTLFEKFQVIPDRVMLDCRYGELFKQIARESESRVLLEIHDFIAPSAERHYILYQQVEFKGLRDSYDEPWNKLMAFDGPPPQPDHTYGFRPSVFTQLQQKKLKANPSDKSYFIMRHDIWFAFMTTHLKCGKNARNIAERAALHSMTTALQSIVHLYRKANRASELHRRALGFSLIYDEKNAIIFVHYPVIDGQETSYYRDIIRRVKISKREDRWTCGRFVLSVCQYFAPVLLAELKNVIDQLSDHPTEAEAAGPGI